MNIIDSLISQLYESALKVCKDSDEAEKLIDHFIEAYYDKSIK